MRVRVVGAGVIGLSCAVRLREAGVDADVVATSTGPRISSMVAAALWFPYRAGPEDLVREWGATTFRELTRLAGNPATGVRLRAGTQLHRDEPPVPLWAADIPDFQVDGNVRPPYRVAWEFRAPVADTTVYLGWLAARLNELGGAVDIAEVPTLDDARRGVDLAVIATGIGARRLPGDPTVQPVHGQVVRVRAPRVDRWVLDESHPQGMVYVVPRHGDVVCGGVADDGFGPPEPDPEVAAQILRRCVEVVPELAGAHVLGAAVGVRPVRPQVRLERDRDLVHCYGHGGSGFTLSWGCADAVRNLVQQP